MSSMHLPNSVPSCTALTDFPRHLRSCRGAQAGSPPPRSALLGAIQGGARLRKTATVDKSIVKGAGAVIGDASAPVQTFVPPPRSPSPPPTAPAPPVLQIQSPEKSSSNAANNRQSVDWYGGLAADTYPSPTLPQASTLAPMREESEEDSSDDETAVMQKQNGTSSDAAGAEEGPEADFDFSACESACQPDFLLGRFMLT